MLKTIAVMFISLTDPVGDHPVDSMIPGKYIDTDIAVVKAANDSANLYFYVEINDSGNLNRLSDTTIYNGAAKISIFIDTDMDSSTGLSWGWWISGYDYLISPLHTPIINEPWSISDAFGVYSYNQKEHPIFQFERIDSACIKEEHDSIRLEASIPLEKIKAKPDSIAVLVIIQEQLDPWLGDYAPDEDSLGTSSLVYRLRRSGPVPVKIDGKFEDWKDIPELKPTHLVPVQTK